MIEGWEKTELQNIAEIKGGYAFKSKLMNQVGGGYQIIKMSNLYGGNLDLSRNPSYLDEVGERELKYKLNNGDIVITLTGTVGKRDYGFCDIIEYQENLLLNQRLAVLKANREKVDCHLLLYIAKSAKFLGGFYGCAVGGTGNQTNVSTERLKELVIDLPPLPEQRKIAEVLKTWDEAIRLTEILITKKQRHKKALMQRLLTGATRFPQFNGQKWQEVHLTDIATVSFSNVDKKTNDNGESIRLCNYMDVFHNDYITDDLKFMEASATPTEIKKFTLKIGDVVFTKDSETADEIAESTVVAEELNNVICGYHLGIIRPDSKEADGFFLSLLLKTHQVHHQFIRLANGVTRYGLNLGSVHLIKVYIPRAAEQKAIVEVFIALDQEIQLLQNKLTALQAQKRGLMQQLLTGRIRVNIEDESQIRTKKEIKHVG